MSRVSALLLALFAIALVGGRPANAAALDAGITELGDGALAYRPPALAAEPRRVLVVLHGAGIAPATMIRNLAPLADKRGWLLLAPKAARATWDLAASLSRSGDPIAMRVRPKPRFRDDPKRIEAALGQLRQRATIDPRAVILAGFSDGATEALSVGLAHPQTYRAVIAMSPGFVLLPTQGIMTQPVYITHGRRDPVLPFAVTENDIVGLLKRVGYRPRLLAFDGEHRMDQALLDTILGELER